MTHTPTDQTALALFIAMVIRNAMEDFHCSHLSDAQMKELNPIIRNAVYTALLQRDNAFVVACIEAMIPDYWEAPQLISI
jgi:hypothetical protein